MNPWRSVPAGILLSAWLVLAGPAGGNQPILPDARSLADRLFLQASLAEMRGDWRQALQGYARVIQADSTLACAAEALFELGLRGGDRSAQDLAAAWLLAHRPSDPLLARWLDRLYLDGRSEPLEDALTRLPAEAHLNLRIQLELDRPDGPAAATLLRRGIALGEAGVGIPAEDAPLFWEQVFVYARRFDRASQAVEWIEASPWAAGVAWAWHVRARLAWLQEDPAAAFAALARGTALDSSEVELPLLEGRLALAGGEYGRASEAFERALRLAPEDSSLLEPLAVAAEQSGRWERAGELRLQLLLREPGLQEHWLGLAAFHDRRGEAERAIEVYRQALQLFGDSSTAVLRNNLAYSLALEGRDLEEALRLARQAVAAEPRSPSFLDTLGWVLFRLGRVAEAEEPLEQALALSGPVDEAEIRGHLGALRQAQGRLDDARLHYGRALELDPDNEDLRRALQALVPAASAAGPTEGQE
jgi:Flp pilus assembly protein TadD